MKVSKTKKAAQSLSTTKDTSSSLDSSSARPRVRDNFWVGNEGEIEDLSVNKMFLKSGSGHQARITLQDVKATLGRANTTHQSSRPSILSQIETTDDLSSKIRPGTSLSPVPPSLTQFSSPHLFPLAPQTLPARVETSRADDGLTMEKSQLEIRKQNTADNGTKGRYLTVKRRAEYRTSNLLSEKYQKLVGFVVLFTYSLISVSDLNDIFAVPKLSV